MSGVKIADNSEDWELCPLNKWKGNSDETNLNCDTQAESLSPQLCYESNIHAYCATLAYERYKREYKRIKIIVLSTIS